MLVILGFSCPFAGLDVRLLFRENPSHDPCRFLCDALVMGDTAQATHTVAAGVPMESEGGRGDSLCFDRTPSSYEKSTVPVKIPLP